MAEPRCVRSCIHASTVRGKGQEERMEGDRKKRKKENRIGREEGNSEMLSEDTRV